MKKAITLLLCLALLTSCVSKECKTIEYIPYADIPAEYSLNDAKTDGLVVFENGDITSGQSVWASFVEASQKGNTCMVRLAFYYTLDDPSRYSAEYYDEIKDDYPMLFIQDLSYDGNMYTLYTVEDGKVYSCSYKYLKRVEDIPQNSNARYTKCVRYVLIDEVIVTWTYLSKSMYSSDSRDWIDFKMVYSDYEYK